MKEISTIKQKRYQQIDAIKGQEKVDDNSGHWTARDYAVQDRNIKPKVVIVKKGYVEVDYLILGNICCCPIKFVSNGLFSDLKKVRDNILSFYFLFFYLTYCYIF